jgi:AAA ATPase domain
MLKNPFTPSFIASSPDDFFGRSEELKLVRAALQMGCVAIHGPIGIGKSSLLARAVLEMEGFDNERVAQAVTVTAYKDITTVDQAARHILEALVDVDEAHKKVTFKIGSLFERESGEITRNFVEGRHLAALQRLLERESLKSALKGDQLLIIAIDEADKCPVPLAQLVRAITSDAQLAGVKSIRFLLAGVSPFYEKMLAEDRGIQRFVYRTISLDPMNPVDAADLLHTKFDAVVQDAHNSGIAIEISDDLVPRIVALSGGHPHILQLLGSYLVEHEDQDPDGRIDSKDLVNSLLRVCYQDRAQAYDATLHMLTLENKLEDLQKLLALTAGRFPTRIPRAKAVETVSPEALKWLVDRDILSLPSVSSAHYGLVDEFLHVRLMLDSEQSERAKEALEATIVQRVSIEDFIEAEDSSESDVDDYVERDYYVRDPEDDDQDDGEEQG